MHMGAPAAEASSAKRMQYAGGMHAESPGPTGLPGLKVHAEPSPGVGASRGQMHAEYRQARPSHRGGR